MPMLRGLFHLTWLEIKIFVREPMGLFGTVGAPLVMYLLMGRLARARPGRAAEDLPRMMTVDLPVVVSIFIAIGAVLSLIAVMAIYREGGILKRLRATPLRPATILTAHVLVKLFFSAITIAAMVLAGRRYAPPGAAAPLVSFGLAVLFSTACISSIGFVVASVVPTARFAQPIGALVLYPMVGLSDLFVPIPLLPPWLQVVAQALPLTRAVSLLRGIWAGGGWLAHSGDVVALVAVFVLCAVVSSRVFRWD